MKLYTRAGDTGRASTLTRQNIPKDSPVFAVLGTLDELTSAIGTAKLQAPQLKAVLEQIQQELLADHPPYNFENEDEQRACELAGKER